MIIKAEIKKRINGDKAIKAIADVVIDNAVVIHGIGVVETERKRYLKMPNSQWKNKDGEEKQKDICHPISAVARKQIEDAVFAEYNRLDEN